MPTLTQNSAWQITSNVCGLRGHSLKNICFKNVRLALNGGADEYNPEVPEEPLTYPEAFVYGRVLPAKGIYFRYIEGLTLENVEISTVYADVREDFVFHSVADLKRVDV